MPTTVITGRDVTFTLDSQSYDAQATSATLSCETIIETYQTLDGRAYKSVDKQWTFTIELLQDWGATSSLFEAMWADAEECLLSDTLEIGDLPQRFYLSPKACKGILNRAERRGKKLPPMLKEALEQQAMGQG